MKTWKIVILFGVLFGIYSCDDSSTKKESSDNNILLQKQKEIEGKAVRNANQLLENQQKQMQNIDG